MKQHNTESNLPANAEEEPFIHSPYDDSLYIAVPGMYGGFRSDITHFTTKELAAEGQYPSIKVKFQDVQSSKHSRVDTLIIPEPCQCNTCTTVSQMDQIFNSNEIMTIEQWICHRLNGINDLSSIVMEYFHDSMNVALSHWVYYTSSACRVVGGSGLEHIITVHGWRQSAEPDPNDY